VGRPPEVKRVLLVEDDPGLRDLIRSQLSQHHITAAPHQAAAYAALQTQPFDLVLLDLRLPVDERDIDPHSQVGFDILGSIRKRHNPSRLPVVVMTAYEGTSETTKRALKSGATEYWNKDGSYSETLPDLVNRVLLEQDAERRQAAQEMAARRHRLEFHPDGTRVTVDGIVTFTKKPCSLLTLLRDSYMKAAESDREPPFIRLPKLADMLEIDQDHVRALVMRIRKRIATAHLRLDGVSPDQNCVIQSQLWEGYRLNPGKVDIADLR